MDLSPTESVAFLSVMVLSYLSALTALSTVIDALEGAYYRKTGGKI
jgi:hypothetical protein